MMQMVLAALGIVGAIMNARRDGRCFKVWGASNALGVVYCGITAQWWLMGMYAVYLALAVYGASFWGRPGEGQGEEQKGGE